MVPMENNREHIQTLLIEKVTGSISNTDNEWVENAIKNDPEVRNMWDEVQQQFGTARSRRFMDNINENTAWDKIKPQLTVVANRGGRKKWLGLAAAIAAIGIVLSFSLLYSNNTLKNSDLTAKNKKQELKLKLADGKEILLARSGKFALGEKNIKVNTTNNKLSYTSIATTTATEWGTLIVPSKLDYQILLPDGTEVWLNSLSNLRFPYNFNGDTREVYLEGEAYFHVAKNADKPFIVHTQQNDIRVLGTKFNVNTYDKDKTVTALVEGSVMATAGDRSLKLTPGNDAVYADGKFTMGSFDKEDVLSWMSGIHYFNNIKLTDLVPVLQRWFDVKVVFDNAHTADLPFTGAIDKNKTLQVFLSNVVTVSNTKYYFKDGDLHFK